MSGHIRRRSASTWELKFETGPRDPTTGKRQTTTRNIRGTKRQAEAKLVELLNQAATGGLVGSSKETTKQFLHRWHRDWAKLHASPKTCERWLQLIDNQVAPHVGNIALQALDASHLVSLYATLMREGAVGGGPLAPRTVHHVHRLLHQAFVHAVAWKAIRASPTQAVKPPKVPNVEIDIPTDTEIAAILKRLDGRNLLMHTVALTALATGARRGELCAFRWKDFDQKADALSIETSLETTREEDPDAGQTRRLRIKSPKTRHGRRKIGIPIELINVLKAHRARQQEERLANGFGRATLNDLIFANSDGSPIDPNTLSRNWLNNTKAATDRDINLHSFRHHHASSLIAAGIDILSVSRRLGHSDASTTLRIYGHLIPNMDSKAVKAVEAVFTRVGIACNG